MRKFKEIRKQLLQSFCHEIVIFTILPRGLIVGVHLLYWPVNETVLAIL
jgi:hypothetical protein